MTYVRILEDEGKKYKIKKMAAVYLCGGHTYRSLAARYNIGKSTVYKYFKIYLPLISPTLAKFVNLKTQLNLESGQKKGLRIMNDPKKKAKKEK